MENRSIRLLKEITKNISIDSTDAAKIARNLAEKQFLDYALPFLPVCSEWEYTLFVPSVLPYYMSTDRSVSWNNGCGYVWETILDGPRAIYEHQKYSLSYIYADTGDVKKSGIGYHPIPGFECVALVGAIALLFKVKRSR